jgi:uncharacterized protein
MYDSTIPVLLHFLGALTGVLKKAEAYCEAKKVDPAVLLSDRLYPDMFPLSRQIQLATDFAKGAGARLSGNEVPKYADEEKTMAELHARIIKTVEFLGSLKAAAFDGAGTRSVTLKMRGQDVTLKGDDYWSNFVLPNFYFHLTTAYNILRHRGVELGKSDFMGR